MSKVLLAKVTYVMIFCSKFTQLFTSKTILLIQNDCNKIQHKTKILEKKRWMNYICNSTISTYRKKFQFILLKHDHKMFRIFLSINALSVVKCSCNITQRKNSKKSRKKGKSIEKILKIFFISNIFYYS